MLTRRMLSSVLACSVFCMPLLLVSMMTTDVAAAAAAHDHDADSEGKSEAGGDAHHDEGPPIYPKADLVVWSIIVFGITLVLLRVFAWGPLTSALDTREAKIRDDIAQAETNRIRAERMLKEHEEKLKSAQDEVREIIAEARRDAEQAAENIRSSAESEANATKERALAEIDRAKDQALKEIFSTMSDQVVSATETVLGRGFSDDDQRRLVSEALDQLPSGS